MLDRVVELSYGTFYCTVLVTCVIFVIPVICMFASSIKNRFRYEVYSAGEVASTTLILFGFALAATFSAAAFITINGDDPLTLILSIVGVGIFAIGFFIYLFVLYKRRKIYGEDTECIGSFAEFLAEIFSIFLK